ncbi:oxygenase MpaB family protein [Gallaecimonas pentaromativorans]|uniref:oxygenase MpaB family protein n=1 Tax=Gallaecimonas pentaromativorans TaxID=584787 RepID=UPI003A927BD7
MRQLIEKQVLSLTGLAIGGVDYHHPKHDPGLYGPESMVWQVHGDFTSMLCGGIAALLLQMMEPRTLAGVWDHSNFRQDMLGRLRRTARFIAATSFASEDQALALIEQVKRIHGKVSGICPYGQPYSANDPPLLTWVHVTEVSSFLAAYLRYKGPLSLDQQDRYYQEAARTAELLGARSVPKSSRQVAEYLEAMRPLLKVDERTRTVRDLLRGGLDGAPHLSPVLALFMAGGCDLLPGWAAEALAVDMSESKRRWVRRGIHGSAKVLRWAVRDSARLRALARMALN